MTRHAFLLAFFAVAAWGASFVAIRMALPALGPFPLVAVRSLLGTAVLAAVSRARGRRVLPRRADRPRAAFLGAVLGLHLLLQAWGLEHTSATHTGWIVAFMPVTIALGAQLVLGQRLGTAAWTGVAVATTGVALLLGEVPAGFAGARLGDAIQLTSCLTWTIYTLAAPPAVASSGALATTTLAMGTAALATLLPVPFAEAWRGSPSLQAGLATLFLGVVVSGLAYAAWFAALSSAGPVRLGSMLYLEPFVTMAVARWLLGEPAGGLVLPGGLTILLGVWLVARGRDATPGTDAGRLRRRRTRAPAR